MHRLRVWTVLVALLAVGCGAGTPAGPKTYPASGRVVDADGRPFAGGMVEFRPLNQGLNAVGTIDARGEFTLRTLGQREPLTGAPEGRYQATIIPLAAQDQTKGGVPEPITLPDTFEVKPDGGNEFTLRLPRLKRR